MSGSVNRVTLLGNLTRDPEVRRLSSGDPVCNLNVATNESWKDKDSGERKERAEFHRVVIFGKLADVAGKYLHKGSKVYLEGQLQTRKWQDQSGADKYATEVVLRGFGSSMVMLDGKSERDEGDGSAGHGSAGLDDEIPFAPVFW